MIEVYSSRVSMCRFVFQSSATTWVLVDPCGILWRRQWFIQHCLAGQCGEGLSGCSLRLSCKLMSCNSCGLCPFHVKVYSCWLGNESRWREFSVKSQMTSLKENSTLLNRTFGSISHSDLLRCLSLNDRWLWGCFCLALIVQQQQPKEGKVDLNWREASLARIPSVSC